MAKVLLVEDDNNLREIYQARLMAEGYDIVAAQNGEEALVVAKQNKPDLIISDVMMPRISGFEMLDILRNTDELKHTRVIMLTALGQAEDQKRASGLGADKYLVKSQVTLEDIVNAAKELLSEDGAVADVPPAPAIPDPIATPAEPAVPVQAPAATTPAPVPVPPATAATPEPAVAPAPEPQAATPAATPATPTAPVPEPAAPAAAAPTPPAPPAPDPVPAPAPAASTLPTPPPAPAPADSTAPAPATAVVPVVEPPDPVPAPEPIISMPTTEPAVAAPAASAAAAAVSDAATQTLEAEEAALQSQIDNYASAPPTPAPASDPVAATSEASNTETIANAVEQLNAPTPEAPLQPPSVTNPPVAPPAAKSQPAPEPASAAPAATPEPAAAPAPAPGPTATATPTPAPAPAPESDNNLAVAGRKIIQPISDPSAKPDLNALLAKEEAAAPAPPAAPVVDGAAAPAPATEPAHLPGQAFDPNKAL